MSRGRREWLVYYSDSGLDIESEFVYTGDHFNTCDEAEKLVNSLQEEWKARGIAVTFIIRSELVYT